MKCRNAFANPATRALLLCSLAWHVPFAHSAEAVALQRFAQARSAFESGRNGNSGAVELAQEKFRQLLSEEPANPLYLAYFGSTYALQARAVSMPWTRIRLVNRSVELLDQALNLLHTSDAAQRTADPAAPLEARLVTIATFIALPDALFHRMAAAKRTLNEALSSPNFSQATADLRGHLIYEGALIAREERDTAAERSALNQVIALAPPSIDAAELRERLAQLR